LAYFLPVIDEVLHLSVNPDYFRYLRQKIERAIQTRYSARPFPIGSLPPLQSLRASGADDLKPNPHAFGVDDIAVAFIAVDEESCSKPGSIQPSATGKLLASP
jgi:hypothetical protein